MVCWIFGSSLLRWVLVGTAKGSTSIYGPLAAPIAVLLWLYVLSIAVLIGAALNAAFDQLWPQKATTSARRELLRRLDSVLPWRSTGPDDDPATSTGTTGTTSGTSGTDASRVGS
jgi:membrane protein